MNETSSTQPRRSRTSLAFWLSAPPDAIASERCRADLARMARAIAEKKAAAGKWERGAAVVHRDPTNSLSCLTMNTPVCVVINAMLQAPYNVCRSFGPKHTAAHDVDNLLEVEDAGGRSGASADVVGIL